MGFANSRNQFAGEHLQFALVQVDFATAAAFLLMSGNATELVNIVCTRWTPSNPLQTLIYKQFIKEFRFAKQDIPRLLNCLQWPPYFRMPNCMTFSAESCLLTVLYSFAFPSTLTKLEIMFGRSASAC